jgi:hypothetical protein
VRKYPGWHHHMLTTMLAHFFLWHLKLRWGKKSPRADDVATANNVQKARKKKIRGTWLALGAIVINVAVLVLGAAE